MGLRILCPDESAPFPRPVVLELTCDGDHGLFPPTPKRFEHRDGFVGEHADAMASGWLERQAPRGRIFLGPCCSGKGKAPGFYADGMPPGLEPVDGPG